MELEIEFPDLFEKTLSGDPEDYKNLAYEYYEFDKQSPLAFEWFMRAAKKDDAESQCRIGTMYYFGEANKDRNLDKAAEWFLKSYKGGFGRALLYLGHMQSSGHDLSYANLPFKSPEAFYTEALNKYGIEDAEEYIEELRQGSLQITLKVDPLRYLEDLVGLENVKEQIRFIEARSNFEKRRENAGLGNLKQTNHFALLGNPGTGKTEVARVIGSLYKKMGILSSGHVIEVDRSDLVAKYVGQTAPRTKEYLDKALDGVLFIDEAHALWDGDPSDFGIEAISTLVKYMEDYRDRLIVIFAGYIGPINQFLSSNPGLKSRVRHYLTLEDYSAEDLAKIYQKFVTDNHYVLHEDAKVAVLRLMEKAKELSDENLGNGRFSRNAFEKTIEKMAARVSRNSIKDKESLQEILFMDIPHLEEVLGKKKLSSGSNDNNVIGIFD